jgi:deazaflavin-dependent oxidoreductase (nitroreductase family)
MPNDLTFKAMNAIHRGILKVTGGRKGWTYADMPALELTTTGRKTGQARTVFLTSPVQEAGVYVVVASRGGDDQAPSWFLNLVADPAVRVARNGEPAVAMRARVATTEERARLWPLVTAKYHPYADYQTKTSREIPLVYLEPSA